MKSTYCIFKVVAVTVLLLGLLFSLLSPARAGGVPYAIKYQAVLHDVEGNVLADRSGLSVRISLRQGHTGGDILYQEDHTDLSTDMFGGIYLEIGRGNSLGNSMEDVDWGNTPVYAQIEVELDGNGYTQMGTSELLSVPYAIYAGNSGDINVGSLRNNVLPKYDSVSKTFVNSGVFQTNNKLTLKSDKITFEGNSSYTFPSGKGLIGQVLAQKDNDGTLGWVDQTGGGSGGGNDPRLNDLGTDGKLVFWDNVVSRLKTSSINYDYNGDGAVTIETPLVWKKGAKTHGKTEISDTLMASGYLSFKGLSPTGAGILLESTDIEIEGNVKGNNNLMLNQLTKDAIWMGNGAGETHEVYLKGNVDRVNDTLFVNIPEYGLTLGLDDTVTLEIDGQRTEPGAFFRLTDYGGVWKYNQAAHAIYANEDTVEVKVGVGTFFPQARMHVKEGSFMVSGTSSITAGWPISGAGNYMAFSPENGAFRLGGIVDDSWDATLPYTMAMGYGAQAAKEHNVAIGKSAAALGTNAMVFGVNSTSEDLSKDCMILGFNNNIRNNVKYAFAIGHDVNITGTETFVIGRNVLGNASSSLAIGSEMTITGKSSIGIGFGSDPANVGSFAVNGQNSVGMGYGINLQGDGVVAIGANIENKAKSQNYSSDRSVVIGNSSKNNGEVGIVMGTDVHNEASYSVLIGQSTGGGPGTLGILGGYMDENSALSVALGNDLGVSNSSMSVSMGTALQTQGVAGAVNIGSYNTLRDPSGMAALKGGVVIGHSLVGEGNGVILGSFNDVSTIHGNNPALLVGGCDENDLKNVLEITNTGDLYIPGVVRAPSDINLKTDIKPLKENFGVLQNLQAVSYVFKKDKDSKLHYGFIAQEVEKYYPHMVSRDRQGTLSLSYVEFIPILWQYTNSLYDALQEKEEQLNKQNDKIMQLEEEILKIKAAIGLK